VRHPSVQWVGEFMRQPNSGDADKMLRCWYFCVIMNMLRGSYLAFAVAAAVVVVDGSNWMVGAVG
jgi:hypothetical protein